MLRVAAYRDYKATDQGITGQIMAKWKRVCHNSERSRPHFGQGRGRPVCGPASLRLRLDFGDAPVGARGCALGEEAMASDGKASRYNRCRRRQNAQGQRVFKACHMGRQDISSGLAPIRGRSNGGQPSNAQPSAGLDPSGDTVPNSLGPSVLSRALGGGGKLVVHRFLNGARNKTHDKSNPYAIGSAGSAILTENLESI